MELLGYLLDLLELRNFRKQIVFDCDDDAIFFYFCKLARLSIICLTNEMHSLVLVAASGSDLYSIR